MAFIACLIATLSGQSTALGTQTKPKSGSPTSSTTTTTLPKVPAAAEPLLKRLIGVAGSITAEQQRASLLSEQYDQAKLSLAQADIHVLQLNSQEQVASRTLESARMQLRQAAIEAYVTGQTSAVDDSLLTNDLSSGSMVEVYASIATGHVSSAIRNYVQALAHAKSLASQARATSGAISRYVSALEALRNKAMQLEFEAAVQINQIKAKLLTLVGKKEMARLLSPLPTGSPYKGPNLAGTSVGKVATTAQGLVAVDAARKLLGIPYVWGGASKQGVDCSGMTMLAWFKAGISIEHSATSQWEESKPVPLTALQPGDLLFYHFAHDGNTPITHVVMYVGSGPYGAATIIQAAHTGTNVSYSQMFFVGLVSAGRP
ncbi:MAG: C40 family peptidase [Acidimicrobiales bacterium]